MTGEQNETMDMVSEVPGENGVEEKGPSMDLRMRTEKAWSEEPQCECGNCGWTGTWDIESFLGISDLKFKVYPGEEVPARQCPECGSLCHVCSS